MSANQRLLLISANQRRVSPDVVLPRQAAHGAGLLEGEGPAVEGRGLVALESALKFKYILSLLFVFARGFDKNNAG